MREYKINMDRSDPTPEEIAQNKDFSKVLNRFTASTAPVYTKTWFLSTATLIVAAGLLIVANLFMDNKNPVKDGDQSYVYQPLELDQMPGTPYVDPPLDDVNIGYETYTVAVGEKSKLDYHTGTKMKVPKNTFVDAEGQEIKGVVEIKYREFHDVADFFVSGIPMDYDSAGVKYHFESAGMIEMLAFQDGEPVFMKPGKEIKIEMASDYEGTHYNLYELDEENERWTYKGKDRVTVATATPLSQHGEETSVEIVADDYYLERAAPIIPEKQESVVQLATELATAKVAVEEVKKTRPNKPQKVNSERYNFDLAVKPGEFPEIAGYKSQRFEIRDENTSFNSSMFGVKWEDVLLEENVAGVSYNLTVSIGDNKYTWVVYPVYEGEDYAKAKELFTEKFEKYKEKLTIRKAEEKKAQEEYEAELAKYEAQRLEQLKAWEEQKRQYTQAQILQNQRRETARKATRAFSITSFGTWNCDSPTPRPRGKSVAASFSDEDGNMLVFSYVYLVQKNRNAMFTYNYNMFGKLKFDPKQENVLWGITSDNKLAVFQTDQFTEIPGGGKEYTFRMKVIEGELSSVADVREAISI